MLERIFLPLSDLASDHGGCTSCVNSGSFLKLNLVIPVSEFCFVFTFYYGKLEAHKSEEASIITSQILMILL